MTVTIIAFMLFLFIWEDQHQIIHKTMPIIESRNVTWSTEKAPSLGPMVVYIKGNGEQENKMEQESLVEQPLGLWGWERVEFKGWRPSKNQQLVFFALWGNRFI